MYSGKDSDQDGKVSGNGHTTSVVQALLSNLTGRGRTLFADNYYNSVNLPFGYLKTTLDWVVRCVATVSATHRKLSTQIQQKVT